MKDLREMLENMSKDKDCGNCPKNKLCPMFLMKELIDGLKSTPLKSCDECDRKDRCDKDIIPIHNNCLKRILPIELLEAITEVHSERTAKELLQDTICFNKPIDGNVEGQFN